MSWDVVKGQWKQIKGSIKNRWGRLTEDEILQLEGDKDRLAGKIQEKYGIGKNEAMKQIDDFQTSLNEPGGKEGSWS
jgi:uncharacterized protein YjbJ (UPF0337 family)